MHLDVIGAAIVVSVVSGCILLVVGDPLKAGRAWCWRTAASYVRRVRSRYRGWRRARYRRRAEAGLNKVRELASREKDCKAVHAWYWPEELKRLWQDAGVQLIERQIDWRVVFEEYGVVVWVGDDTMHMHWGRSTIHVRIDLKGFGMSGDIHDLAGWDLTSQTEQRGD